MVLPHELFRLGEIFVRADLEVFRLAPLLDFRTGRFRLVKSLQASDHPINLGLSSQAFREQLPQEPAVRQFSHLQAVLSDFSFCCERKVGSALIYRDYSQVGVRA